MSLLIDGLKQREKLVKTKIQILSKITHINLSGEEYRAIWFAVAVLTDERTKTLNQIKEMLNDTNSGRHN